MSEKINIRARTIKENDDNYIYLNPLDNNTIEEIIKNSSTAEKLVENFVEEYKKIYEKDEVKRVLIEQNQRVFSNHIGSQLELYPIKNENSYWDKIREGKNYINYNISYFNNKSLGNAVNSYLVRNIL